MKLRTFVILLVICGILGGAAYFMSGQDNQSEDKQLKMGENLLGKLPVKDIASITIKSNEDSVALKKGDPVWVIENRFNYPANFSMTSACPLLLQALDTVTGWKSFPNTNVIDYNCFSPVTASLNFQPNAEIIV